MLRIIKSVISSPLRKVLTGTIIVTSTSGGTFAPAKQDFAWLDVRREFESKNGESDAAFELEAVMSLYDSGQLELPTAIRLSYLEVTAPLVSSVDQFWTDYLTTQDTSVSIETLIALRDEVIGNANLDNEDILRDWLWKAQGANDYDCVAHQGSNRNCGVGKGLDGNNGTPGEGLGG